LPRAPTDTRPFDIIAVSTEKSVSEYVIIENAFCQFAADA